jgi:7-carboxy-7-deazaguanine synthase
MKRNLVISEKFLSIQGEGQTMGIPSIFIRLAGCNILCKGDGWICDSIEVWQKGVKTDFEDVLSEDWIERLRNGCHLVFTGGEPLLHQSKIVNYLDWVKDTYSFVPIIEIETNGTLMPSEELIKYVTYWNCSPKLANSGESFERRVKPLVIDKIGCQQNSIFKFVVGNKNDVLDMLQEYGNLLSMRKVVLMPAGETQEKLNKIRATIMDCCVELNVRYCDRLHIVGWNQKTGV